jgi:hypothetical protein
MFEIGQTVRTHYEVTGLLEPPPYGRWYGGVQSRTRMPVLLWTIGAPFARTRDERQELLERLVRCYEVRHPNFAPLVDCFLEGDELVAVLGVGSAPSIAAYLARRKSEGTPVELGEARVILEHLCGAVAALHDIGLVLGELRPEAVRITPSGVAVVSVAAGIQASAVELVRSLRRAGAGRWMAPELHHGGRVGQDADVYSLAALAHLVIYGEPHGWPDGVRRGLFASIGRRLAHGAWRARPAQRYPAVDEVLRTALSGAPDRRPVNAEALFAMLERAIRSSLQKTMLAAPAPVAAPAPSVAHQPTMQTGGYAATPAQKTMLADMSALPLTPVSPAPVQLAPSARTMMVEPGPPPAVAAPATAPQIFSMGTQLPPTAATMMVEPPAPAPVVEQPRWAPPSAMHLPPEESTMMVGAPLLPTAPATTTPSTPTIMAEPRAPVIADPPRSSLALDIDIGAFEAVGAEKNKTREVDTNEIAQILANDIARDPVPAPVATSSPTAEANKTREVDAKEIADLLARTRRDE